MDLKLFPYRFIIQKNPDQCTSSSEEDLKLKHVLPILFYSRHLRSFEILICMTDIFAVNTLLNMSCREKYDLQHTYGVLVEWLHL